MARPSLNLGNSRAMTASRSRSPASCATASFGLRRTPMGVLRGSIRPRSSCQRARPMMIGPSGGSGSSSATWMKASVAGWPSLMSGIELFLEGCLAEAAISIDEPLAFLAVFEIGVDDLLDRIHHLVGRESGPDDLTDAGVLVGAAAERDLIELLALLVDAENADMAHMMVATGIDA